MDLDKVADFEIRKKKKFVLVNEDKTKKITLDESDQSLQSSRMFYNDPKIIKGQEKIHYNEMVFYIIFFFFN